MIYLIGSLRNPEIPQIAKVLRTQGIEVFDEWYAAGPNADDCWRDYEKGRGWSYERAVGSSEAAKHVFDFDYDHLVKCDAAILALPAGKSAHLELGWVLGAGKPGYILLDNPDRWDVMYKFAWMVSSDITRIVNDYQHLMKDRQKDPKGPTSYRHQQCVLCGAATNYGDLVHFNDCPLVKVHP